jgi:hypothetical protein
MAASTAASVGGGIANRNTQRQNADRVAARNLQVARERNAVRDQYRERQKAWGDEAQGENTKAIDAMGPDAQAKKQGDVTDARAEVAQNIQRAPVAGEAPISGSAPSVVEGEIASRMMKAYQDSQAQAGRAAKLGGYGDVWQRNALDLNDTNRRVNTLNNFSRGDMSLLGYDQDFAEYLVPQAKMKSNVWGDVLTGAGKLGSAAAGSGAFAPAAAAAPAAGAAAGGLIPSQVLGSTSRGWANPLQRA